MTRRNEDKMGSNEFEGADTVEEKIYYEKVERRFTKKMNAKMGQDGRVSKKVGGSHADDGGEHRF